LQSSSSHHVFCVAPTALVLASFAVGLMGCDEGPTDPDFRSHDYGATSPTTHTPGQRPQGGGSYRASDVNPEAASLDTGAPLADGGADARSGAVAPPVAPCSVELQPESLADLCTWFGQCLAEAECPTAATSAKLDEAERHCLEVMPPAEHVAICGLRDCEGLLVGRDYCLLLD